ncbi:hypothetical protein [Streptantibioticus ferralitis]|uniref:Uncharacterized protein n=1 Tax=Streptantibioticus ferralitis TaxID=236510 RepID=A0ABT5Z1C1_9ACTN|nr:hypothetical protein [Streptantibioticus ferralitis]MDF2257632.1 hypothetical protein [Streptantibioticus ferralitis]
MTACATKTAAASGTARRSGFSIAADGSYAACLTQGASPPTGSVHDTGWYPERWTLSGPEPYTVPLPGRQPEAVDAQVLPLPDGRVLIRRRSADRHDLALLYPTGPGTGELPVGFLHGESVRLLPALPCGTAYALGYANGRSTVWLVHGGPGLEQRAEIDGRCTGGVWLDRAGRLLALDREHEGRTKTIAVDLCTGATSPLLQITEESDDRLLLADPDSKLLLVRSNAPGTHRLGWGVLDSRRPVRFPDCLREPGGSDAATPSAPQIEPLAIQPGQLLMPESCAVVLRIGRRAVLWRPSARGLWPLPTPPGWLVGSAWWSADGTLRLPYARPEQPYGVRDITSAALSDPVPRATRTPGPAVGAPSVPRPMTPVSRVLPLRQAPLAGVR